MSSSVASRTANTSGTKAPNQPRDKAAPRSDAARLSTSERTRQQAYTQGSILLGVSLLLAALWYLNPEQMPICRNQIRHILLQTWEWKGDDEALSEAVALFLKFSKESLRGLSILVFTISLCFFGGATFRDIDNSSSSSLVDGLTKAQRRLLGLDPLPDKSKNFSSLDLMRQATPVGRALPLSSSPFASSSSASKSSADKILTPGMGGDVSSAAYLSPPPSSYGRFTPTGSSGGGGRPPLGRRSGGTSGGRNGGGGATLSFGESAGEKVRNLLDEMLLSPGLDSVPPQQQTPQGGGFNGMGMDGGQQQFISSVPISPITKEVVGPYRESPLGGNGGGLLGGSTGSPAEQYDAADWPRMLQSRVGDGLDTFKLAHYVDNLREALYVEIVELLTRFEAAVRALERCGVPLELLLEQVKTSPSGYSLEDFLGQARTGGWGKEVYEYVGLKRVLAEGENWTDLFGHVWRRLEELVEDSYLSGYDWSRGGILRDRNVTVELPTDADLIMHLFLWRCDAGGEHRLHEGDRPFVKQHFLQVAPGTEETSRTLRGRNLIMRYGTSLPYFSVVENGTIYRIPKGKDNALVAVVLFLFLARRDRWLPTYNQGYRRLLENVFGSVVHPGSDGVGKSKGKGGKRVGGVRGGGRPLALTGGGRL
ncbi:hypothetical protein VYU27_003624 [Nannochloropsis oceanica]